MQILQIIMRNSICYMNEVPVEKRVCLLYVCKRVAKGKIKIYNKENESNKERKFYEI